MTLNQKVSKSKRKEKQAIQASKAYATMLTDDSYLAGVQVLSYTLRRSGMS